MHLKRYIFQNNFVLIKIKYIVEVHSDLVPILEFLRHYSLLEIFFRLLNIVKVYLGVLNMDLFLDMFFFFPLQQKDNKIE